MTALANRFYEAGCGALLGADGLLGQIEGGLRLLEAVGYGSAQGN